MCFLVMASEKAMYEQSRRRRNANERRVYQVLYPWLCANQFILLTSPPPGIPRAFDTFFIPGVGEFDLFNRYRGGAFDINRRDVGHLTTK